MKCTLMHKRLRVAEIETDDATGFIKKVYEIYDARHLPVGIPVKKGALDRSELNEWWTDRSIPDSRSDIREALDEMGIVNTKMLMVRCYGLSLSDQYWICPEGSCLTWDSVNFFSNGFSDDVGDVLFGAKRKAEGFDFSSPDNTSDGNLKKRWKIINGKSCLLKGGSNPFRQQPFNEVIASEIMQRLGICHVPYTVTWINGAPYSVCEDFITENTELIPAWRILKTGKKDNSTSIYQHFINCCEALGIKGAVDYLDRMIVTDYIIANEDRHLNNFGMIRDAETLEWIGFAPIYDSGSSLGYDKMPAQIRSEKEVICKPFKNHHSEQLKLVKDFGWIDFDSLSDVGEMITGILSSDFAGDYIDETRIQAIVKSVEKRLSRLSEFAATAKPAQTTSTEDDVKENIAKSYK